MTLQQGFILHNRYRIEGRLGKGGMGAVYLAFDQTLQIKVAVKENLNINPESERQFRREASLLASLRHPNLPRVTDHFILEDRQYLVMDYIEGVDLHTRVVRQPPSVNEILSWAHAIGDALAYLHSRQPPVIHRDVKPANLKLQPDGTIILVDFGIAKVFNQEQTTTGARGMTPGFSPPEQYGGGRTDPRSDQYSLAATLYSLFTGQAPTDSIERAVNKSPLTPIRSLNPEVPEYVDRAIQKAMTLDQNGRYPDILSFQAALRGEAGAKTISISAPSILAEKRIPIALIAGLGIVSLVVVGIMIFLILRSVLHRASEATPTIQPTSPAVALVSTEAPTLAIIQPSPSPQPTDTPIPTPAATTTPTPIPTEPVPQVGGGGRIAFVSNRENSRTLQIYTMNPDGSDVVQLTFGPGDKTEPCWSPDGTRLLFSAPGSQNPSDNLGLDLWIMQADGSGISKITHHPGDDTEPDWSPDGDQILFTSDRTGGLKQVFLLDAACLEEPPDCVDAKPQNISFSEEFSAVEYSPAWAPSAFSPPAWLPPEHTIAVVVSVKGGPGRIYLRGPFTAKPTDFDRRLKIQGVDDLAWSPDGKLIAFTWFTTLSTNEVYVVRMEDRGYEQFKLTNSLGNKEPVFSPDGQWIAFTSTRDQNPEIYLMRTDGSDQQNLTRHTSQDMQADWQPMP